MEYADHPLSLAEIRSDKSNSGSDWTPRDALIAMLRELDAGRLEIETLFICATVPAKIKGGANATFSVAAASPIAALGCIELSKARYIRAAHGD